LSDLQDTRSPFFKTILTHASCLMTGFALAAWSLPKTKDTNQPRTAALTDKPSFWVSVPLAAIDHLDELVSLRGKNIHLLRRTDDQSCIIDHAPLKLEIMDRALILAAPISTLESFYLNILPQDLLHIRVIEPGTPTPLQLCRTTPKITYGD
jgi:hypothetical protein